MKHDANSIDEYFAPLAGDVRSTLENLRATIRAAVPEAEESISYGMPAFKYRGKRLIYVAAAKNHCAIYGTSAGTVRFTPAEPLAPDFIRGLVRERVEAIESAEAAAAGKKKAEPRA